MSTIRVDLAREFMFGDDVVLLAMDGAGVTTFAAALNVAAQQGQSRLEHGGITHEFLIRAGGSDVEFDGTRVVWHFDPAKAGEVADALDTLSGHHCSGHQYIDITQPADTLVLSRDEYVGS